MALTVNTDTYISLADCDTYLAANYISTDAKYVAWAALTDANCEVLLRKAAQTIDRQPLAGYKYISTQAMAFPRYTYSESADDNTNLHPLLRANGYYCDGTVPDAVKYAQCEIAIELAQGSNARADMQRQGVKSFSLGNLSETYTGSQNSIISHEAKQLLVPYLGGGFRVG
jgi:hypothetical protein